MRLTDLEIFREQMTELFPRRSGKSVAAYNWILAIVEVLGPSEFEYGFPQDGSRIRSQVDRWAKSRDWAKWFLKEVQQIPPLLTERVYSYVRSSPSRPRRMEIDKPPSPIIIDEFLPVDKPPSLIIIDEFLPVAEGEWEKHILPL